MTNKNKSKEVLKKVPPSKRPDIPNTGCILYNGYRSKEEAEKADKELKKFTIDVCVITFGITYILVRLIMLCD